MLESAIKLKGSFQKHYTYMFYSYFNPLTPMSEQDRISHAISTRQVIRIKKNINLRIIS